MIDRDDVLKVRRYIIIINFPSIQKGKLLTYSTSFSSCCLFFSLLFFSPTRQNYSYTRPELRESYGKKSSMFSWSSETEKIYMTMVRKILHTVASWWRLYTHDFGGRQRREEEEKSSRKIEKNRKMKMKHIKGRAKRVVEKTIGEDDRRESLI